jgi:peptidoglycan/xylan/chitin deacetylase (PgdA/CDA1 family)
MKKMICFLILLLTIFNGSICDAAERTTDQFPEKGIPILMYHSISTDPKNSLCVSEKQFREEIEWLYEQGYQTISLNELYNSINDSASIPEQPILISFDDGYADNYKTAWPILKEYNFTATFFIVTDFISPYRISWDQLKELVDNGNSIGSHTVHHYDLASLMYERQKYELNESKELLERNLGISINAICYPSGKYNKTTLSLLPKLGYKLGFTTKPGKVYYENNQFLLSRIRIWGGMPLSNFKNKIV